MENTTTSGTHLGQKMLCKKPNDSSPKPQMLNNKQKGFARMAMWVGGWGWGGMRGRWRAVGGVVGGGDPENMLLSIPF
jgi:hypothetical protein